MKACFARTHLPVQFAARNSANMLTRDMREALRRAQHSERCSRSAGASDFAHIARESTRSRASSHSHVSLTLAAAHATRERRACLERCSHVAARKKMFRIFDALRTEAARPRLIRPGRRPLRLASPWPSLASQRLPQGAAARLTSTACCVQHPKGC